MVRALVGDSTITKVDMASFYIWMDGGAVRVSNLQSVGRMSRLRGTLGDDFKLP